MFSKLKIFSLLFVAIISFAVKKSITEEVKDITTLRSEVNRTFNILHETIVSNVELGLEELKDANKMLDKKMVKYEKWARESLANAVNAILKQLDDIAERVGAEQEDIAPITCYKEAREDLRVLPGKLQDDVVKSCLAKHAGKVKYEIHKATDTIEQILDVDVKMLKKEMVRCSQDKDEEKCLLEVKEKLIERKQVMVEKITSIVKSGEDAVERVMSKLEECESQATEDVITGGTEIIGVVLKCVSAKLSKGSIWNKIWGDLSPDVSTPESACNFYLGSPEFCSTLEDHYQIYKFW